MTMPNILSDPPTSLYAIPAVVGLLSLLAAFLLVGGKPRSRDPKQKQQKQSSPRLFLIILGAGMILVMFGIWLIDRAYESDREQIVRKLNEMSQGVKDRDLNRVFQHVSDSFRIGTATKSQLRSAGERAIQHGEVTEIPIWDVSVEPVSKEDNTATARFRFKVEGSIFKAGNQFICKAVFVREGSEWRLQSFEVYMPPNERDPITVPGI